MAGPLLALTALAFAPLAGLLLRVWTQGGYLSGADGLLVLDQMQYLNWLRQSGTDVLIGNLYDLAPGPRTFLHPGLLLSGLLHDLGLGAIASYLVWKPVAVLALWAGAVAWCRRLLPDERRRRTAVWLSLLFASPIAAFVGWTGIGGPSATFHFDFLSGELTAGNYLWGYVFTAIAVGLMPLGLLAHESGRTGWAAAAGLVVAWLQPWQGATFLLVVLGAEALRWRATGTRPPLGPIAAVGAATAAPLVYYLVLSRTDDAWRLAGEANDFGSWPWWVTVLGLLTLAWPALTAPRPAAEFAPLALRVWPLAALLVYLQPFGTFPAHALQGLVLPLVVLSVLGIAGRLRGAALAVVGFLLIVPGTLYRADQLRAAVSAGRQPFFLTDGERAALRALDRDPRPGGVLAPIYSGLLVPAYTQRETWVGAGSWTPDFDARTQDTERLFSGRMGGAEARDYVRRTRARFLLADCHGRADVGPLLAGLVVAERRFGCARVWEVRGAR
jgi:hypothetical protein